VLEPSVVASSEAVHCAVQVDGRDCLMSLDDSIQDSWVFDVGSALVVDDDIVFFSPIELSIQGQYGRCGAVVGPVNVDLNIGSGLNAFANSLLLFRVIVAAATGDEQSTNGFAFRFLAECGRADQGCKNGKSSEK